MHTTTIDTCTKNQGTFSPQSKTQFLKRIWLAEDDDDDFFLINSAIVSFNNSVELLRTKNGFTLLSLLQTATKPDLIVLDINMPFKSGLLLLEEIKTNPQLNNIKVVMYSTSRRREDIDACFALGADFYLVKPMRYSDIIKQFQMLFTSPYFKKNVRVPYDQFLIDYNF